ncbi:MAG TPA: hypothetical protein VK327_18830, partial [Candidatus Paceibacterota bacterium]|nr:hypothetical protein [Candidatus Paceibacterota bacterium]
GRICSLAFFVNSYIRKPHDFDRFVELMREVCRYWLMLNERPEPHKSYDTTQGIDHRGLPG